MINRVEEERLKLYAEIATNNNELLNEDVIIQSQILDKLILREQKRMQLGGESIE